MINLRTLHMDEQFFLNRLAHDVGIPVSRLWNLLTSGQSKGQAAVKIENERITSLSLDHPDLPLHPLCTLSFWPLSSLHHLTLGHMEAGFYHFPLMGRIKSLHFLLSDDYYELSLLDAVNVEELKIKFTGGFRVDVCCKEKTGKLFRNSKKVRKFVLPDSAKHRHQALQSYNWDDGMVVIRALGAGDHMLQATAKGLYAGLGPNYYQQFQNEDDCRAKQPKQVDDFRLLKQIEDRILSASYPEAGGDYDYLERDADRFEILEDAAWEIPACIQQVSTSTGQLNEHGVNSAIYVIKKGLKRFDTEPDLKYLDKQKILKKCLRALILETRKISTLLVQNKVQDRSVWKKIRSKIEEPEWIYPLIKFTHKSIQKRLETEAVFKQPDDSWDKEKW